MVQSVVSHQYYFQVGEIYTPLFDDITYVWEALNNLELFLSECGCSSNTGSSSVHADAYVHPTAIVTNSFIGAFAKIYEGVVIRDSMIGRGTVVGHHSEVARSIVMESASIPRFNYLGSSIIGNGVRLGGMVSCASRRFDSGEVVIKTRDAEYRTGRGKLGSIIGDASIIGFAAHCNPGTLIGPGCLVSPHVEVVGFVPSRSLIVVNQASRIVRRPESLNLADACNEDEVE